MPKVDPEQIRARTLERNVLFAKVFQTEDGQAVIRELQNITLDNATYFVDKPPNAPHDEGLFGAWRDGQNQLFRWIVGRVRLGQEGKGDV